MDEFPASAAAEWRDLMPGTDAATVEVAIRLRRVARNLHNALQNEVAAAGMSAVGDYETVALLYRRGPLRPTVVAHELGVTLAAVNGRTKRLLARQLVRRLPDPEDGRSFLLDLTEDGRQAGTDGFSCAYEAYTAMLAEHTQTEIERLAALLGKIPDLRRPTGD